MKPRLCVEIPQRVGSTIRDATKEEIKQAEETKAKLDSLRKELEALQNQINVIEAQCDHKVIFDKEAFLYDVRQCFGCGKGMGLI
jgi:hypothetical protein